MPSFRATLAFLTILTLVFLVLPSSAQQLDCTVQVNYEAVGTSQKDYLRDFADDVRNYLNNYQWGSDQIQEKVRCTIDIFIQGIAGENKYMAQVFVGSQRPIYGTNKNTATVRIFDEAWEFTYIKNRPITHAPYSFNDLTSFLDFYAYLILGYDYDTYERMSGTTWFQKAADVASLGRSSSQKGWQLVTTGYGRTQLVTDLLNPTVAPIRAASYRYHFAGLDSMATDTERGLNNIVGAMEEIGAARKSIDSRNLVLKTFFDTKYMEIAELLLGYPDPAVYVMLSRIDPSHQKTYEEYLQKRQ